MKITQEDKDFNPITITLETKDEAILFWDFLVFGRSKRPANLKDFERKLSDWFSNEAQL